MNQDDTDDSLKELGFDGRPDDMPPGPGPANPANACPWRCPTCGAGCVWITDPDEIQTPPHRGWQCTQCPHDDSYDQDDGLKPGRYRSIDDE
jgi:hypothetical protein